MGDDTGSSLVSTDPEGSSDADLVRAAREGSRRAYAALWARHSPGATRYARSLSPSDADDIVSEAFLKVYVAVKDGRGPEADFRYYLRAAVRNTYVSMMRARRSVPAGDAIEDVVGDAGAEAATVTRYDGSAAARAFLSLPARWQEVLWYLEVEGLSREHAATLLGLKANAVSALAFRARDALRTAWLQEHVNRAQDLDAECARTAALLGAHSRQALPQRETTRVDSHVADCAHCATALDDLATLLTPGRLALVMVPALIGTTAAAALAGKLTAGSAVLASATTAGAPAVTATVAAGGAAAAGSGAMLSLIGKAAACALVAGAVIVPAPLLMGASAPEPGAHAAAADETAPERPGELSHVHPRTHAEGDAAPARPAPAAPAVREVDSTIPTEGGDDTPPTPDREEAAAPAESSGAAETDAPAPAIADPVDQGDVEADSPSTATGAAEDRPAVPAQRTANAAAAAPPAADARPAPPAVPAETPRGGSGAVSSPAQAVLEAIATGEIPRADAAVAEAPAPAAPAAGPAGP